MENALNLEKLQKALAGLPIPRILFFEETDSTNEQGLAQAAQGAQEFTLLIAERQSAGRGRMGRKWITAPGSSLAFSLILHPGEHEISRLGLFSLLGGLAVCRAAEDFGCADAQVKWPNDALLDGKKTAGILAETSWQGGQLAGVVLGIGVNLQPGAVPPPEAVLFPATCVQAHTAKPVERLAFLRAVLEQLIELRGRIQTSSFLDEYTRRMAFIGQGVILHAAQGEEIAGVVLGVQEDGRLHMRLADGEEADFPIGDLKLRPG